MNPAAILALIGTLFDQLTQAQEEIQQLRAQLSQGVSGGDQ